MTAKDRAQKLLINPFLPAKLHAKLITQEEWERLQLEKKLYISMSSSVREEAPPEGQVPPKGPTPNRHERRRAARLSRGSR